jgi:hypothetical protein
MVLLLYIFDHLCCHWYLGLVVCLRPSSKFNFFFFEILDDNKLFQGVGVGNNSGSTAPTSSITNNTPTPSIAGNTSSTTAAVTT